MDFATILARTGRLHPNAMFSPTEYELLDFGDGRKLERFGEAIIDRPSPSATGPPAELDLWKNSVRYDREKRRWSGNVAALGKKWRINFDTLQFELIATDSGQVGIFPEQAGNWQWMIKRLRNRSNVKVLNLFAFTGASSLAAAKAGAAVVHVDAAKGVVNWARRNAEQSGLADTPIRWLVEDAPKYVQREIKRGNKYDGIILDPPSYGHGPKGNEWKLSRDLFDLLTNCKQLLSKDPVLFLLSCHTPGFGPPELSAALSTCLFGSCGRGVKTRDLSLATRDGRRLAAGHAAYWP